MYGIIFFFHIEHIRLGFSIPVRLRGVLRDLEHEVLRCASKVQLKDRSKSKRQSVTIFRPSWQSSLVLVVPVESNGGIGDCSIFVLVLFGG